MVCSSSTNFLLCQFGRTDFYHGPVRTEKLLFICLRATSTKIRAIIKCEQGWLNNPLTENTSIACYIKGSASGVKTKTTENNRTCLSVLVISSILYRSSRLNISRGAWFVHDSSLVKYFGVQMGLTIASHAIFRQPFAMPFNKCGARAAKRKT